MTKVPDWAIAAAAKLGVSTAPPPPPPPRRAKAFAEPDSVGHQLPAAAPVELVWVMPVPWEVQVMEECRRWHHARE